MRRSWWVMLVLVGIAGLCLGGCKKTRSDVRYFFSWGHLSSDAPAADVYIDGNLVFEDLAPGDVTGYIRLSARPNDLTFREAGTTTILAGPVEPDPIPSGGRQTVLLIGRMSDDSLDLLRYNQKNGRPSNDRTRYLLAHGVFDVDRIDFILNGDIVGRSVRYLEASRVAGEKVGPVQVKVRRNEGGLKIIGKRAYSVPDNLDYSLLLIGRLDDGSLEAVMLQDETGAIFEPASLIRFIHAIPSVEESLDIFIDGNLATKRIQYGNTEKYLAIVPGTYRISARGGTSKEEIIDLGDVTVTSGEATTLVMHDLDSAGGGVTQSRYDDPEVPAVELTGRVRFLHLGLDVGPLDLFIDNERVGDGVVFRDASDFVTVSSGTADVRLEESGTGAILIDRNFRIRQGEDFTIMAIGLLGGDPELELVRLEDDIDP